MSSQPFRRVLAGSLVTAFLSLIPASVVAAEPLEVSEAPSIWSLACQWLLEQISLTESAPVAVGSAEGPAESGSDAGWMLDPDG